MEMQGEAREEMGKDALQSFAEHSPISILLLEEHELPVNPQACKMGSLEFD